VTSTDGDTLADTLILMLEGARVSRQTMGPDGLSSKSSYQPRPSSPRSPLSTPGRPAQGRKPAPEAPRDVAASRPHSIENPERDRCSDVFAGSSGSFGFDEFRRDVEDFGA
jgi:hypothetical protein